MAPKRSSPAVAQPRRARSKILSRAQAVRVLAQAKKRDEKIVFTNGCFDLLHIGHVRSLEEARSLGDRLIVAINTDASVRRLKGPSRPIISEKQRAEVIAGLECVDYVVFFGEDTPLALICALEPDVLAKGGDWKIASIVGAKEMRSWGGTVKRLREIPKSRTTAIVARIHGQKA